MSLVEEIDFINTHWRSLWKQLRRRFGDEAKGYVKVVELTKRGTPHLHILLDCPFVSQRWLSERWNELTGNNIVDVRRIGSATELARYVSKYLTKQHGPTTHRRRWSASNGYLPDAPPPELGDGEIPPTWKYFASSVDAMEAFLASRGAVLLNEWWWLPPGERLWVAPPTDQPPRF